MIFHRKTELFSNQTLLLHAELKHKNYLQLLYVCTKIVFTTKNLRTQSFFNQDKEVT